MSRTVTVYSTSGSSEGQTVATEATNWRSLQEDLGRASINYNGMKAIIGETKHTLESPEATLPEGDFRLFLMPVRTKSGGKPDGSYDPPAPKDAEAEMEVPANDFGLAAEAVQKALSENDKWIDDRNKLRLVLMMEDLTEMAFTIAEQNSNPVMAEMKDIAKDISGVGI